MGRAECAKLASHSFKYMQHLLDQDEVLEGTVDPATGTMNLELELDSILAYYRISKSGRLGRALDTDETGVEKQAHDDEGPTLFLSLNGGVEEHGAGAGAGTEA